MIPTVGRDVHTTLPEGHPNKGGHRAAKVTAVYANDKGEVVDGAVVDVTVFLQHHESAGAGFHSATGFLFLEGVRCDPTGKEPGTWHEPERVEQAKKPAGEPKA